jgi:hypothetical protein
MLDFSLVFTPAFEAPQFARLPDRKARVDWAGAILRSVPRRGVLPVEEGSTSIVAGLVE